LPLLVIPIRFVDPLDRIGPDLVLLSAVDLDVLRFLCGYPALLLLTKERQSVRLPLPGRLLLPHGLEHSVLLPSGEGVSLLDLAGYDLLTAVPVGGGERTLLPGPCIGPSLSNASEQGSGVTELNCDWHDVYP